MGGLFSIDPALVDANLLYLGLIVSLWIGVTAAYLPGTTIIETVATIGFIGSLIVLAQMPTNWVAVLLIIIGVGSFIVMPFIRQQYAALAVGGLGLQAVGSVFLFHDGVSVSLIVIAGTILLPLGYHQWVLMPMLRNARNLPTVDKDDTLIGMVGRVTRSLDPIGTVYVNSESWSAIAEDGVTLEPGDMVTVLERDGLRLIVEKIKSKRSQNGQHNGHHEEEAETLKS